MKAGLNKWEDIAESRLTQPQELQGLPGCWLAATLKLPQVTALVLCQRQFLHHIPASLAD